MRVAFESCLFDSAQRGLWREGEQVRLSPKAFRLLEILLERRPNAVAQRELYDELWPDTIVDFANLHNLVSQVRGAIGDRRHVAVRTVYGFGFSFAAPAEEVREAEPGGNSTYALVIEGSIYPLRIGANVIGRSAAADVKIFHPSLSRSHTRLVIVGEAITIEDLGSKNGTFVNAKRLDAVLTVTPSDRLRFGTISGRIVSDDLETEDVQSAAAAGAGGEP